MDTKNTIETVGYILKEEKIATLTQNIIPNTLVLETQKAYPGYHGKDLPEEFSFPEFIYFITREKYTTEHILRVSEAVQKYFDKKLDVARAELTIYNNIYHSFRLKECVDYTRVLEIQTFYKSEGIQFAKSKKIEATGLIQVQKTFALKETPEGIYHDLQEPNYFYIKLPINLNWEKFKAITLNIKRNIDNDNFDAALGLFYRTIGIVDFVRIYDKESSPEKLLDLKERYFNEIKKHLLDKFK
jgi:hypothetical protein